MNRSQLCTTTKLNEADRCVALHFPLFQDDIIGMIASFVPIYDLRTSFVHVCKQWNEIGMEIAKGMNLWSRHL